MRSFTIPIFWTPIRRERRDLSPAALEREGPRGFFASANEENAQKITENLWESEKTKRGIDFCYAMEYYIHK